MANSTTLSTGKNNLAMGRKGRSSGAGTGFKKIDGNQQHWSSHAPTVFVVDGDPKVHQSVSKLVLGMNMQCRTFFSGPDFFDAYDPACRGCLVVEVRIVAMGGLEIQKRLAAMRAPLPVVFLSGHATVPVVVRAMQAGAVDFLEKPLREQELWEAIQEAIHLDGARREQLDRQCRERIRVEQLSEKERRILSFLAEGKSRRSIAAEMELSVRSVELARAKAMKKLEIESHVELLRFAIDALDCPDSPMDDPTIENGDCLVGG